jgi:ubiquitin C-terminal hydrolase
MQCSGMDMWNYLTGSLQNRIRSSGYGHSSMSNPTSSSAQTPNGPIPLHRFDLYAISNHYGGLNGGHYTACVRHPALGSWCGFDDSRVVEICKIGDVGAEERVVKGKGAYSLFYVSEVFRNGFGKL